MNVTDGDREKADRLVEAACNAAYHDEDDEYGNAIEAVAAALAEEREKARAPFLALADEYDLIPLDHPEARRIVRKVADRIRRAAGEGS